MTAPYGFYKLTEISLQYNLWWPDHYITWGVTGRVLMPIPAAYGQKQDSNQLGGLEVWELAQENIANALKVFWHFPILPAFHFALNWFVFWKKIYQKSHLNIYLYQGNGFPFWRKRLYCMWMCVCVSQGQKSPTSTPCTPSQSLCSDDVWDSISPGLPQEHDSVVALLSHNGDWWDSSCSLHFVYNWN